MSGAKVAISSTMEATFLVFALSATRKGRLAVKSASRVARLNLNAAHVGDREASSSSGSVSRSGLFIIQPRQIVRKYHRVQVSSSSQEFEVPKLLGEN